MENVMEFEYKFQIPGTESTIPLIGYGTSYIKDRSVLVNCVDAAICAGCRLFDTSASYDNEKNLGVALKQCMSKYKIKREQLFITTKLSQSDLLADAVKAVRKSLGYLNCKYIDLYLIEWPGTTQLDPFSPENAVARQTCWASLIKAKEKGLVKHLGVSNFTVQHLSGLLQNCMNVKPVVNQLEWHPFWHPKDLEDLCKNEGILIQAYNSLGGSRKDELLTNRHVVRVAKEHNINPAKVLLRWAIQQGFGVIPSSKNPDHIRDNMNLHFQISAESIQALNNLKQTSFMPNLTSIQ